MDIQKLFAGGSFVYFATKLTIIFSPSGKLSRCGILAEVLGQSGRTTSHHLSLRMSEVKVQVGEA